jgi:hypothetical protein
MLLGAALCGSAIVWHLWVAPRWTPRVPPGWKWEARFVGTQTFADPETGEFPDKDQTGIYERSIRIAAETARPRSVRLEDRYLISDPRNGRITWEYVYAADVDPATGEHLAPEYRGQYFVFPRNVEKHTYVLRYSYLKGVLLAFAKEDEIDELRTYLFSYRGPAEYTESYAGMKDYPGVPVQPGQQIKCADDQFLFRVWVEPITGETVKLEESCYAGDYVYDVATEKRVQAVLRWGGTTAGDDVMRRAGAVRRERTRILWIERYVPALLAIMGVLLMALPASGRFSSSEHTDQLEVA